MQFKCIKLLKVFIERTDSTWTQTNNPVLQHYFRGSWAAQLVKPLTSAQVMISQFVSLNPASGSVLTAQGLKLALDSVSPSLSAPPMLMFSLSLSLSLSVSQK